MHRLRLSTGLLWTFAACAITFICLSVVSISPSTLWQQRHMTAEEVFRDGLFQDVANATLGFQKVFVLNLPSRTDRRDSMSLAARLTGIDVEYLAGVTDVDDKALPPGGLKLNLNAPGRGSWRSHLNAATRMVEENIQSALILEDDVDWDIRIKSQMMDFARASRLLIQPQPDGEYLDPSYHHQPSDSSNQDHKDFNINDDQYTTGIPSTSPYGDLENWDVLWLGHCGGRFPSPEDTIPRARVIIPDDETVPEPSMIDVEFGSQELITEYPSHTRVVSREAVNTCILGYALSLPGARRLLYELGIRQLLNPLDLEIRSLCEGSQGRSHNIKCLTVHPQLFQHHRPAGSRAGFSDISDLGKGYNKHASTKNIRWSARMNIAKMIEGRTDYDDQFEDGR